MFAVPGWNVPAASLVKEKSVPKPENGRSSGKDKSVTKKRKRENNGTEQSSKVTGLDLENLWNQRREAKVPKQSESAQRRPRSNEPNADTKRKVTEEVKDSSKKSRQKARGDKGKREHTKPLGNAGVEGAGKDGASEVPGTKSTPTETSKTVLQTLPPVPSAAKLTPLQAKMRTKLTSARFRHLNETLYTTSSSDALNLFTTSPDLFAEYHAGFSQQVKDSWPQNPVDQYVRSILSRGKLTDPKTSANINTLASIPLPRRKTGSCTIADLGCGDAPLARGCQSQIKALKLKFHNYDLHAPNNFVTKADISNLPLRDGEADIVVFCLSLMGTNWLSFVEEAWRVLRGDGKGEVWVAEVKSRFGRVTKGPGHVVENSVGKRRKVPQAKREDEVDGEELLVEEKEAIADGTDISAFVKAFSRRGFVLREDSVDKSNKMFVSMVFNKSGVPAAGKHKGLKWTGQEYQKVQEGRPKFVSGKRGNDDDHDVPPEEESNVLKPCVYKTR
ncbi:methyltransferase-domain-containing protein [Exophiala viscosa]|uniref:Ribosomal RNA-processing protein 8 n=1 Tax=Exophiala viscosa TaxID=2486360 RepID=A0AAN6IIT0_9EURO|nr:methyltransferase-domain-containing protein [Exophiala viscosa]